MSTASGSRSRAWHQAESVGPASVPANAAKSARTAAWQASLPTSYGILYTPLIGEAGLFLFPYRWLSTLN